MFVVERFCLPLSLSFCCESPLHSALIVDRKYRPVNAFKFFCAGDVPKKDGSEPDFLHYSSLEPLLPRQVIGKVNSAAERQLKN